MLARPFKMKIFIHEFDWEWLPTTIYNYGYLWPIK